MNLTVQCRNKRLANDTSLAHADLCDKASQIIKIFSIHSHMLI